MQGCTQSHFGLTCAFKNTAQVHSKSLWAHKGGQKHRENSRKPCAGALKVILGSLACSKTLRRCTQSHFGLTMAVILLVNMCTFCMGPSTTRVFLLLMHIGAQNTHVICIYSAWGIKDTCFCLLLLLTGCNISPWNTLLVFMHENQLFYAIFEGSGGPSGSVWKQSFCLCAWKSHVWAHFESHV